MCVDRKSSCKDSVSKAIENSGYPSVRAFGMDLVDRNKNSVQMSFGEANSAVDCFVVLV